jgi:hypothetical protein
MRYESSTRRPRASGAWAFQSVLLAAALAACSADDPTSPAAPAPDTPAASIDASANQAQAAPTALSNRFAYVWANQPSAPVNTPYTPSASYAYNATGGSIQVIRQGTGMYQVIFNSPTGWTGARLGFGITAYGSSTLGCSLRGHFSNASQLWVDVRCYNRVTHAGADSRFTLLVVGNGSLLPRSAFAFGNQPSAPSYTPNPLASYTSGTGAMLITHGTIAGDYSVNLGTGTPAHSTFLVGEQFFFPGYLCTLGAWHNPTVQVRCFDQNGSPKDMAFWILQVQGGRPGRRIGFAWANLPSDATYAPNLNYSFNSSGGAITVTRSALGRYSVDFAGLQKLTGRTENVQVTPFGVGYSACKVVAWGNAGAALRVSVECRKLDGTFKDARFNVLVIE